MDLDELNGLLATAMATRATANASRPELVTALAALGRARNALDALQTELTRRLAGVGAEPTTTIADTSRVGLRDAARIVERTAALDSFPALAAALDHGDISGAHVDAVGQVLRSMAPGDRSALTGRDQFLAGVACRATPDTLARTARAEAARLSSADPEQRLARQRRATELRTWVEHTTGMWCGRFQFDPATALAVDAVLQQRLAALFADATPDTCPTNPVQKQGHLRALALADLVLTAGDAGAGPDAGLDADQRPRPAGGGRRLRQVRADVALVFDLDRLDDDGNPAPQVDLGLPLALPVGAIRALCANAVINPILVRNGTVVGGVGELDQGRRARLANRAQRRALRVMYPTCAIPGCDVPYAHTKPHHVIWWRHGGNTNLDNLLPLCSRHHHHVHDDGWQLKLLADRTLHVTLPDGTTMHTGPPWRQRG